MRKDWITRFLIVLALAAGTTTLTVGREQESGFEEAGEGLGDEIDDAT